MNWFEILKGKKRLGGYIQSGSFEAALNKITADFTAGKIDAIEYQAKREALRVQFGKMLDYDFD